MKVLPGLRDLAGLALAAGFAVYEGWTFQEFVWSTWLAGLLFSWACVGTGGLYLMISAPARRAAYVKHLPALGPVPASLFLVGFALGVAVLSGVIVYVYAWVFAVYGTLLSFFAEMEPHSLFGRDGFINSDFLTPITYLLLLFWPMAAGVLLANSEDLLRGDPWHRILLPVRTGILRVHLLTVATPFAALFAWVLLGDAYHTVAIVLLMALFYLVPRFDREIHLMDH